MEGRRRRQFIHKICTGEDTWVQGDDNIAAEACKFFEGMFTGQQVRTEEDMMQCIPRLVSIDQNHSSGHANYG